MSQPTTHENQKPLLPSPISTSTSTQATKETEDTSPTSHSDGRRNSSGEALPSPTETWKPTFNRVQSWNREDRKREFVLKQEVLNHEGVGGGFSEGDKRELV